MSESLSEMPSRDLFKMIPADEKGAVRDEALARISSKTTEVKKKLDAGAAPAEYQVLGKIHTALETSGKVVSKAWDLAKTQREKEGT
jgi:hypothetical protein